MNHPTKSKINWAMAVVALIGISRSAGYLPPDMEKHLITLATLFVPPLVILFRTKFTGNK